MYDLYKPLNLDIFIKYSKSIKNYLKLIEITQNHLNCSKIMYFDTFFLEIIIIVLFSKILNNLFTQYVRMNHLRHQNCNIEHTGMKYLKNKSKSKILKIKNSLLKLEKYFKKLKDKEQKEMIKN